MNEKDPSQPKALERQRIRPEAKRQIWRQIWLPLVVGLLLGIALVVGLVWPRVGTVSTWADIALVLMLFPLMLVGLLLIALVGAMFYGVSQVSGKMVEPMRKGQAGLQRVERVARRGGDAVVWPFIALRAGWAVAQNIRRGLLSIFRIE